MITVTSLRPEGDEIVRKIREHLKPVPRQQELDLSVDTSWVHFFKELVRSGTWAAMSPAAKAIYPVIKCHANQSTGRAYPRVDTLEELTGCARHTVIKGINDLVKLGLVEKHVSPGKNTIYYVRDQFIVKDGQGNGIAVAETPYIPDKIRQALEQLKSSLANVVAESKGRTEVHIHNLSFTIADRIVNITVPAASEGELNSFLLDESAAGAQSAIARWQKVAREKDKAGQPKN